MVAFGEYEESNLIELLFAVANKIRLDPDLLQAWFYPDRTAAAAEKAADGSRFAGATRKNDFPIFYLLVEYVYHDGRIGDFARTGLLYLTETASKSKPLEKWMIESDLATLMASGLGALYSRLSRRLPSAPQPNQLPLILAYSDFDPSPSEPGPDAIEFTSDMDAFLGYLMFWQDTLYHCGSTEVSDTLMDHFQVLFIEQLLYPSLLESSDIDGGSTASVITYLHRILGVLDHPDLVQRILRYLLAAQSASQTKSRPKMSLSRRKSLDVLAALAEAEDNPSPDLFNLVDLITMSLKSRRTQTVSATLGLVSIILRKHHRYAQKTLFKTIPAAEDNLRTMKQLDQQMQHLFFLATSIADDGTIETSYEDLSNDAVNLLEHHSCAVHPESGDKAVLQALTNDDTLFSACRYLLERYFSNGIMVNLALTEVLAHLASCAHVTLTPWFWSPTSAAPPKTSISESPLIALLSELVQQVQAWQSEIPEWDTLIAAQKASFAEDALHESTNRPAAGNVLVDRSTTPPPPKRQSLDIPGQMLDAYAQSITPRGRKPLNLSSFDARTSSNGSVSPSPAPRQRPQQRSHVGSPLRDSMVPQNSWTSTRGSSRAVSAAPDSLTRRIMLPNAEEPAKLPAVERLRLGSDLESGSESGSPGTVTPSDQGYDSPTATVSLGHILTNAIILQEFILEMAALAQTRAWLCGEVKFE